MVSELPRVRGIERPRASINALRSVSKDHNALVVQEPDGPSLYLVE